MALTDTAIRLAKAGEVDRKLADEKGLFLLVTTTGSKLWRWKYRLNGKEKKLALDSYPAVGLKEARDRRDAVRKSAEAGSDPAAAKREARISRHFAAANTFGAIAEECIAKLEAGKKAAVTVAKTRWLLGKLSPSLGTRPIAEITPHELLAVLKATERAGHLETARRLRSFSSRVFRYAVVTARATVDPAQPLQGALVAPTAKHHAAIIDPVAFGAHHGWATTAPVRGIFKRAFAAAGLPYFNPHSFRDMLVRHAMALNLSPEAMKAWSQNLGHSDVLTTFTSYGSIPAHRQGDLIRTVIANDSGAGASREQIATLEMLLAGLKKGSGRG